MKITERAQLKIGQWATTCCHQDLYQIKTQDQIEEVVDDWDDEDGFDTEVWETKLEALTEIRGRWSEPGPIAEIDRMIAALPIPGDQDE